MYGLEDIHMKVNMVNLHHGILQKARDEVTVFCLRC